jgi:hypothetical protein
MAMQTNRLDKASPLKLGRRFRRGVRNSDCKPNAPVQAPLRGAASGAPNIPEDASSSKSSVVLHAEKTGLRHSSDAKHTLDAPSNKSADNSGTEIDFAELKNGTLVELVEDSKEPSRTRLAVWKDGEVQFVDRLEQDGQVFVPLARNNELLRHLRLPSAVTPYESVPALLHDLELLIAQCAAVDEKYVPVLADFVLSTWFVDRLPVAPYLSVVGLPQTGKTTLLRVLSLVCRRPLLIADITSASFYQACTRFMPTMLIDETGSIRGNRTLRHILRAGTTREGLAVQRNRTFHSFGAKVISSLEPPDDAALNSRCIVIPMSESKSTALVRPDEPLVQQEAAELQAQLLRFRFENYRRVQPAAVPGDECLRPRTRDLLRALTAAHADVPRSQSLLKFFETGQGVQAEPLAPEHNAVLRALFSAIHIPGDITCIWISDLTQRVNIFLELAGEKLRLQPRKVGAVLTSLGFSSHARTNSGYVISLYRQDAEKLHQLAASHAIDGIGDSFEGSPPEECSLCLAAGVGKKEPGPQDGINRIQVTPRGTLKIRVRR